MSATVPHLGSDDDFLDPHDAALLARNFATSEPEAVEGLVERLPAIGGMPQILFAYDVTPAKGSRRPWIHCAHCHGARHWKGWVIDLGDGQRALVGKNCGKEQYGLDFQKVENAFRSKESRQLDLRWLLRARQSIALVRLGCETLGEAPAFEAYRTYRTALTRHFGQFGIMARTAAANGDRLIANRYVRDTAREEARAQQQRPELFELAATPAAQRARVKQLRAWMDKQDPLWRTEAVDHGGCGGLALLTTTTLPDAILAQAVTDLTTLERLLRTRRSSHWTAFEFKIGRDLLKTGFAKAEQAMALLSALPAFASAANLRRVQLWLADEGDSSVTVDGTTLANKQRAVRLALPADYRVPAMVELAELFAAINRGEASSSVSAL